MTEMATFINGNSGSKYTADKMCYAANSADHNYSPVRLIATDGVVWSMCLFVRNGDKHCKNG